MTTQSYSLSSVLGGSGGALPKLDLSGVTAAISATTGQDAGPIGDAVTSGLNQVMTMELGNVLGKAWAGSAQVKAALAATKNKPEAVAFVPLAPHRITTTHKPRVELMMAGMKIAPLPFDVVLAMDLKGVELEISGGRIVSARAGILVGEGAIHFSGSPILKAQTPPLPLPGQLKFALEAPVLAEGASTAPAPQT